MATEVSVSDEPVRVMVVDDHPVWRDGVRGDLEESPHVKVLVLSASGEEADVLEAVKVGASGYLLKSATAAEVAEAVTRVRAGEPVFSPSLAALVLGEFRRMSSAATEPGL